MKTYSAVELPGLDVIEAEKDEVIITPDMVSFAIDGKRHSQGGTKMLAEPGSVILSQHLKFDADTVKGLGMGKKKASPAALAKKVDTQQWQEIMDSKDKRYDDLAKSTAALMFSKNAAKLASIYHAQETMKAKRGMKNDLEGATNAMFKCGGKKKQSGGLTSNAVPGVFPTFNNLPVTVNNDRTAGYSTEENGVKTMYWRPFANDPYFDIQGELLSGKKRTPAQTKILGERQQRLSSIPSLFPGQEGLIIQKEYAKYLQAADKIEPDQYLDKFVIAQDGTETPLQQATEAQIDAAKGFRYFNKRTGKNDLVDYRDRQNQGFDPVIKYVLPEAQKPVDTTNIPLKPIQPLKRAPNLPNFQSVPSTSIPSETKRGIDWQAIINGTQIGLLASDYASVRTKPPYYAYQPSELAYTRFEPLNTKQQERAFNIASEAINNSSAPIQVKNAQLANMYGNMVEGVNQIDTTNYQAKLANDNRNVSLYNQVRNADIDKQQAANLQYIQEADRRNYLAAAQRQEYLSNALKIWNDHISNRRDVRLVNQFARNYDYNFNTEQVGYVPNQGVPANLNAEKLAAYRSVGPNTGTIDPKYLNADGLRAIYGQ